MSEIIIFPRESEGRSWGSSLRELPVVQIIGCASKIAQLWYSAKELDLKHTQIWSETMRGLGEMNQQNIRHIEKSKLRRTMLKPLAEAEAARLLRRHSRPDKDVSGEPSIWQRIQMILGLKRKKQR